MPDVIQLPIRSKPKFGAKCNHCGLCCMVSLCECAKMTGLTEAPCDHLRFVDGNALCGLMLAEAAAGMERIVAHVLGAELTRLKDWQNRVEYAARLLLARLEEIHGRDYWTSRPDTDLQEAAQKLAAIIKP